MKIGLMVQIFYRPPGSQDYNRQGHPKYGQNQISKAKKKTVPPIPGDFPGEYAPNTVSTD